MKKYKLFSKRGGALIAGFALMASALTSCLKDNGPGSVDFSKSPALVAWQYHAGSPVPLTTKMLGKSTDTTGVEVALSVASITLGSNVTATVALDNAGANAYIADHPGSHILPSNLYTIPNPVVTIKAGQQFAKLKINFKGDQIDFDQNYILGLKITSANGAQVPSNLNAAILVITLQSIYEGTYDYKGYALRLGDNQLTGNFSGASAPLGTVSKYAVSFSPLWGDGKGFIAGIDGTFLTVDPATNKVTAASSTNGTLKEDAGYNNHYDPATKTFYVSFSWSTPGTRQSIDTLTYSGPL